MKVITPEISWHEREPIYSIDFQPGQRSIQRLASGGVDKIVRIWQMTLDDEGKGNVDFLSNLRRHTATVNVVRFSKTGDLLASSGDDSTIILWKLSDVAAPANNIFAEDDAEDDKESWVCHKTLRGHLGDVADLSWSKDDRYLVSGSVDNCAIVWDVIKDAKVAIFNEHKSYVQGVAFDPLGYYVATMSADRSMRLYNFHSKNCVHNVSKMTLPSAQPSVINDAGEVSGPQTESKQKPFRIFHDDSLRSFFRRLDFSPDGQLLMAPAGVMELGEGKTVNTSFVFARGAFTKPALYLPSVDKTTRVVRTNPQLFQLRPVIDTSAQDKLSAEDSESNKKTEWEKHKSIFCLPYRIVYAVATEDSVLIYDTQQTMPIGLLKNIHYCPISDLSWTRDGKALIISSEDGFCTIATFDDNELGTPHRQECTEDGIASTPSRKDLNLSSAAEDNTSSADTPLPTAQRSKTPKSKGEKGGKTPQTSSNSKKRKSIPKDGKPRMPTRTPESKKNEQKSVPKPPKSNLLQDVEALKIEDVSMKEANPDKAVPERGSEEPESKQDMKMELSPQSQLKDEDKNASQKNAPKKRIQLTTLSLISKK